MMAGRKKRDSGRLVMLGHVDDGRYHSTPHRRSPGQHGAHAFSWLYQGAIGLGKHSGFPYKDHWMDVSPVSIVQRTRLPSALWSTFAARCMQHQATSACRLPVYLLAPVILVQARFIAIGKSSWRAMGDPSHRGSCVPGDS